MNHQDTDLEKSRVVSLKFGLWKEDIICNRRYDEFNSRCSCGADSELDDGHFTPPPDLTSPTGADLLMTALTAKDLEISFWVQADDGTRGCMIYDDDKMKFNGYGHTWRHALSDAGYKLAIGDKEHAE